MKPLIDLQGKTFGKWKVLKRGPNKKQGQAQWICMCECRDLKVVAGNHLRGGKSTQCKSCHNKSFNLRHGRYKTSTYRIWEMMLQRCHNPVNRAYGDYGGRGIYVCTPWREDFLNFWADMGDRPSELTLDRTDNDGPYSKDNCAWVSRLDQMNNTRRSKKAGQIYKNWEIIENLPYSQNSRFKCTECGREKTTATYYITSGRGARCKCRQTGQHRTYSQLSFPV